MKYMDKYLIATNLWIIHTLGFKLNILIRYMPERDVDKNIYK